MATKPQGSRLQITLVWQDVLPRKRYFKKKKKNQQEAEYSMPYIVQRRVYHSRNCE